MDLDGFEPRAKAALLAKFPFLEGFLANFEAPVGAVVFLQVCAELPLELSLEYGRHNNVPCNLYARGYTSARIWDVNGNYRLFHIQEGNTPLGDILNWDDEIVLLTWRHRSELVRQDPGLIQLDLYLAPAVQAAIDKINTPARQFIQECVAKAAKAAKAAKSPGLVRD